MANNTMTVGGKGDVPVVFPNIANFGSGAFTAGDAIGGLLTFPVGKSGIISGITIVETTDTVQASAMDLLLFSTLITGGTDNAAFNPLDVEALRGVGKLSVAAGDYSTLTANAIAHVSGLATSFRVAPSGLGISNVAASGSLIAVTTLTNHGLSSGTTVFISGVEGVGGSVNKDWVITVTSATAFTLNGSTHSGTYVSGTGFVKKSPEEKHWNLYGQLVARGTPTYAAATNLAVKLHILQD